MEREKNYTDSRRLQAVQPPIIPVVTDLIRANPGTISLGQGVVHYGPPASALARAKACLADPETHKYAPVLGIPPLREALLDKLRSRNGIALGARYRLAVTAGSNMGFYYALLAIAEPGEEIILTHPYYFNHEMAVTMAGCRTVLVATDRHYQLALDRVAAAITARTKAIVTISPNNPTGAVYPEGTLRGVNALCRRHGLYHISDEAYEDFTYGDAVHFSPASIETAGEHTISLFSLSKGYGFAGWRIGYMLIPAHLEEAVNKIQDTVLICPPVVSQYAALGALEAGDGYRTEKIRGIAEVRGIVLDKLAELGPLIDLPRADGAFYVLLRVHTEQNDMSLVKALIEHHAVAMIPGSAFGISAGCYLRIAYGALEKATAAEGITRLVRGLKSLLAGAD